MGNLQNISENTGVASFPTLYNSNNAIIKEGFDSIERSIENIANTNNTYSSRMNDLNTIVARMSEKFEAMTQEYTNLKEKYNEISSNYETLLSNYNTVMSYYSNVNTLIEKINEKLNKII